jgi:heme oxygenase
VASGAGLAAALHDGTAAWHRIAERAGLMPELLRGHISRAAYCALLRNLHALYFALETQLQRHATEAAIIELDCADLARCAALASDLDLLHGAGWQTQIPLQPALQAYVVRITEVSSTAPWKLAAHAYVRYLGDLSGGQIVRRALASALALSDGAGQAFYRFEEEPRQRAARLRAALDRLPLTAVQEAEVVDEAVRGFALHVELFEQLAAAWP